MSYQLQVSEDSPCGQYIQNIVLTENVTPEEVLSRLLQEGLRVTTNSSIGHSSKRRYTDFFGIAKGRPGAHGSSEAADKYLEELRDSW